MKTVQIQVSDKFLGLLNNFSKNEVKILEETQTSDDEYLQTIPNMVESIKKGFEEAKLQNLGKLPKRELKDILDEI
jgi:hypothetical protein